jgi:hypothetical protein
MISISLIDPLKPETPVGVELGLGPGFEAAIDPPPPPQDIRITQISVFKCFIIYSQKD